MCMYIAPARTLVPSTLSRAALRDNALIILMHCALTNKAGLLRAFTERLVRSFARGHLMMKLECMSQCSLSQIENRQGATGRIRAISASCRELILFDSVFVAESSQHPSTTPLAAREPVHIREIETQIVSHCRFARKLSYSLAGSVVEPCLMLWEWNKVFHSEWTSWGESRASWTRKLCVEANKMVTCVCDSKSFFWFRDEISNFFDWGWKTAKHFGEIQSRRHTHCMIITCQNRP